MRAVQAIILAVVCLQPCWPQTPLELNSSGIEYYRRGKYKEAEEAYRKALAVFGQGPIKDFAAYTATLNNLAGTLQTQGRLEEARRLLIDVIALEPKISQDDPVLPHAMSNLALIYQAEREHPKAIALLQRALQRPPSNSDTRAGTLHNLGAVYFDYGQFKKAKQFFEESLRLHKEIGALERLPPTLTFLAKLASKAGDKTQAYLLLNRATELRREHFGAVHPLVGLGLSDLADLQIEGQQYEEAAVSYQEALRILEQSVGPNHIYPASVMFRYAELERRRGLHEKALGLYERSIRILDPILGAKHPRLIEVYKGASMSAAKLKRKEEATEYARRASQIEGGQINYGRHSIDVSAFNPR